MPVKLKNSLLGLLLLLCLSCQTKSTYQAEPSYETWIPDPYDWRINLPSRPLTRGSSNVRLPREILPELPANFVWSEHSTTPLNKHVSASYWNDTHQYWVVLWHRGYDWRTSVKTVVLLCLQKEQLEGCWTRYKLDSGLVVKTCGRHPIAVSRLRVLKEEFFRGTNDCGMKLFYNGKVSRSEWPMYDIATYMSWLRFEVAPKENKQNVISAVKELYPLLEQEPDASDFLPCLESLLSGHDESNK
jgi:hypothetical protein